MPVEMIYYQYAHNDFLQIYFEYGAVALTAVIIFMCITFIKSRQSVLAMSAFTSYCIAMFFYFPLHSLVGRLLLVVLIIYVFKRGKHEVR